jgi:hypothetical protein
MNSQIAALVVAGMGSSLAAQATARRLALVGDPVEMQRNVAVAGRLDWADNPIGNLRSRAGQLTTPFRTDQWVAEADPLPLGPSRPKITC